MILQVLNLSKVSTVFCSPQCKSQPSSLGSRPSGTVLNLVGTSNFKVINYIKRGQNYYVVTIYYFLQNWYQLNNKNSTSNPQSPSKVERSLLLIQLRIQVPKRPDQPRSRCMVLKCDFIQIDCLSMLLYDNFDTLFIWFL